ncbi:MAG: PEGA domain-containing protein [Spirochaetia bacterium]|nr:PEGA domain-containing protein [Spirochaetia bacterium]
MLKKKWLTVLITFIICNGYIFAAQKTVAVLNFSNYGGAGINYLSNALPESVSASLADIKEIKVVERRNLGNLLNEIALEQTGVINTMGVDRVGKIAKADVLVLGSISGDPENLVLTLKAVDVESGKVVDAKIIKGHLGKIFDLSSQAARSMGAIISGEGIGKLSISTNPSGADVYIDGVEVGKSPLVEYALTIGKHRVKTTLNGYLDFEETVNIKSGVHENLSPLLTESKTRKMAEIGAGVSYFYPLVIVSDIKPNPYYYFYFGQSFNKLKVGLEVGFSFLTHDQTYKWFGVEKTRKRDYTFFTSLLQVIYAPFNWQYVSPYLGVFVGYTHLAETSTLGSENNLYKTNMVNLGASTGITIMPYSRVSISLDAKFFYHPIAISRDVYGQLGIGPLSVVKTDKFLFNAVTIGGSVKYNFSFL